MILCVLIVLFFNCSNENISHPYNPEKKYTPTELEQDFNALVTTLKQAHGHLYAYISPDGFNDQTNAIKKELDREMTEMQFYRLLAPFVSSIRCGHTEIKPSLNHSHFLNSHRISIPLGYVLLDSKSPPHFGRGVIPEHIIQPCASDLPPAEDPILKYALKKIEINEATYPDIHKAVRDGNLENVKSILSSHQNLLNAKDSLVGHTPLTLSAAYSKWDIFQYLIKLGADVNIITRASTTSMHCVCQHDRPDMLELLFSKGGAPCLKVKDIFGEYTPMLRAVQRGNKEAVLFLFEKGASPKETTKEGWNALHLAAKCGHRHLYEMLKQKGVPMSAKDQYGKTPMEYDWVRPEPIPMDPSLYDEYVGFYSWKEAPDRAGVNIFISDGCLMLDDNSLNKIYPIGKDTFYCDHDPWKVSFYRSDMGVVDQIELQFLRRSVVLEKVIH